MWVGTIALRTYWRLGGQGAQNPSAVSPSFLMRNLLRNGA
jgi:hypothetical protein